MTHLRSELTTAVRHDPAARSATRVGRPEPVPPVPPPTRPLPDLPDEPVPMPAPTDPPLPKPGEPASWEPAGGQRRRARSSSALFMPDRPGTFARCASA